MMISKVYTRENPQAKIGTIGECGITQVKVRVSSTSWWNNHYPGGGRSLDKVHNNNTYHGYLSLSLCVR